MMAALRCRGALRSGRGPRGGSRSPWLSGRRRGASSLVERSRRSIARAFGRRGARLERTGVSGWSDGSMSSSAEEIGERWQDNMAARARLRGCKPGEQAAQAGTWRQSAIKIQRYPSLAASGDGAMQRIARIEDTSYLPLEGGLFGRQKRAFPQLSDRRRGPDCSSTAPENLFPI